MSDRIISDGEEWAVIDVANDRRITYSSWDAFDPEREARKLYDAAPWEYMRLERRRVVRYEPVTVEIRSPERSSESHDSEEADR